MNTEYSDQPIIRKSGLEYWANEVLRQSDKAGHNLDPDPVHDLRVALRRCRSLAEGLRVIDPDPGWKKWKRQAKHLFGRLGDLRDVQVMAEWINRLSGPEDSVAKDLLHFFTEQEEQLKELARNAITEFDREEWRTLAETLGERARTVPVDGIVFQHLAVERWQNAYDLHRRALKNRTQTAFHQLRIGVKKFRYTVENFLPVCHQKWGKDLRDIQDLLGDLHDLDVLWARLKERLHIGTAELSPWHSRIEDERRQRLSQYRSKMLGKDSLWHVWRSELPSGEHLDRAALTRITTWASFLDPDPEHSKLVARLTLGIYDGLVRDGVLRSNDNTRRMLEAAAILHDVGRAKAKPGHHKRSWRLIRKLPTPLGWTLQELRAVAAIARYHRGALPRRDHRCLAGIPQFLRARVTRLAGVMRLAHAFDLAHDRQVQRVNVGTKEGALVMHCENYSETGPLAEPIAAARHLLEIGCGMPILIRSWSEPSSVNV